MPRIRRYIPDARRSRRASIALATAFLSITLLVAGIGMDMANRARSQPMATISLLSEIAGLAGGITAYVVNRLD